MKNVLKYKEANLPAFEQMISKYGWLVYEDALSDEFVEEINNSLDDAYQARRSIQVENGIAANMDGTLHHLIERDSFAVKFLEGKYASREIGLFLDGNYIINSFGAVINLQHTSPYVQHIHRDIRTFTGEFKLMIQMIVLLDDFTADNGATYFLSGSHLSDDKPNDQDFYASADRAIAKKGSIILFDANLWHAAGKNLTSKPRKALTMAFTRPFLKQQLDYPRFLGYTFGEGLSKDLRQVLGYNSRVPADLYEYYQPVEKRMYQPGQG